MSDRPLTSTEHGVTAGVDGGRRSVGAAPGRFACEHGGDAAPPSTPSGQRSRLWTVLLIAALAVLPYANSLENDFTFDDPLVVSDNPVVREERLGAALTAVYPLGSVYRPVTMASYVVNQRFGREAAAFRLGNIGLHALVSVAVYALVLALLRAPRVATLTAALFAVHPIHSEAVVAIVGRAELFAALFGLACLLAEARAAARGATAWGWRAAALLAFALALLSKESALTVIPLVLLTTARVAATGVPAQARRLVPYLLIGAAYLALRLHVVGALGWPEPPSPLDNPLAHVGAVQRLQTAAVVLSQYLCQLTVPITLAADYSFDAIPLVRSWADPRLLYGAAILTAAAAAMLLLARRVPALALAGWLAVVPLALTANVLLPIGTMKAERLLYLPSLGWCLATGWLLAEAMRRRAAPATAAVVLVLIAFGARTWVRNADWRDERTVYATALAVSPDSAKAHHNLAVALQRAGEFDDAMVHFRRALEIYPDYAAAAFGIAKVYGLKGLDAGAVHWYQEAVRRDWGFAKAHLQLGMLRQRRGDYAAAEASFTAGLESESDNPLLLVNLAAARLALGDRWGAETAVRRLHDLRPTDPTVRAAQREIEVALQ